MKFMRLFGLLTLLALMACNDKPAASAKSDAKNTHSSALDLTRFDKLITSALFASVAKHPARINAFMIDNEQADESRCYYASSYMSGNELAFVCVANAGTFHDGKRHDNSVQSSALAPTLAYWTTAKGAREKNMQAKVIVARISNVALDIQVSVLTNSSTKSGKTMQMNVVALAEKSVAVISSKPVSGNN
jgi:uncharacterized protein involved in copper resistance